MRFTTAGGQGCGTGFGALHCRTRQQRNSSAAACRRQPGAPALPRPPDAALIAAQALAHKGTARQRRMPQIHRGSGAERGALSRGALRGAGGGAAPGAQVARLRGGWGWGGGGGGVGGGEGGQGRANVGKRASDGSGGTNTVGRPQGPAKSGPPVEMRPSSVWGGLTAVPGALWLRLRLRLRRSPDSGAAGEGGGERRGAGVRG